jgi:hypothetical protein
MAPSPSKTSVTDHADLFNILICLLLLLISVMATHPVLEMGVDDDWSYNQMCRYFAGTGHIRYNGWCQMPLVPQLLWGAAFVKLFGFSFLILRISTVLLTASLVPVVYFMGRSSGLEPRFALFATLTTILSPLFVPLEVSFMSDVPAFFFFALCMYGGVKAWRARTVANCLVYGLLISIAGILSGFCRQIYWLAPLCFLPTIALVQRRIRAAALGLVALLAFTAGAILLSWRWYTSQPFTLSDIYFLAWKYYDLRSVAFNGFLLAAKMAATVALLLVPVLVGLIPVGLRAANRAFLFIPFGLAGATGIAALRFHVLRPPWLFGVLPTIGSMEVVWPLAVQLFLSMVVVLSCAFAAIVLWRQGSFWPGKWINACTPLPLITLGSLFVAGWLAAIFLRSLGAAIYDRYLIFLLPLMVIPMLWMIQLGIGPQLGIWRWSALALFALYGIGVTNDSFAAGRARLAAAQALEHLGIPRTRIAAGFQHDGQTQVDIQGYVNHPWIVRPVGAYRPVKCTDNSPWYLHLVPVLRPSYFVTFSEIPFLTEGPVRPISYTTWIPPARRQVYTGTLASGYLGCN